MPKRLFSIVVLFLASQNIFAYHQWAVVGAGLAGVISVAVLLENNVDPATIIWIDPEFNMGRMGKCYRNVPANTNIRILKQFFNTNKFLKKFPSESREKLFSYSPEACLPLYVVIDPLLDATDYLRTQVTSLQETVQCIVSENNEWVLECASGTIRAKKVILATGGYPKKLDYPLQEIPLDEALDKSKLAVNVNSNDSVAVFGGMHSAILILKYLTELGVNKIFNFYTTPYQYRVSGAESLQGITLEWAHTVLEQHPPTNLLRIQSTPENIRCHLPECNKVIYAIGFERNPLLINGTHEYCADERTGIIFANLFGIGMAFPVTIKTLKCSKVAIHGFVNYSARARTLIPKWIQS